MFGFKVCLVMTESVVTNDKDLYPTNHLFILSPKNPLRKACVAISTSKVFDFFIILTIATNCVIMGLNTPLPAGDKSNINNNLVCLLLNFVIIKLLFSVSKTKNSSENVFHFFLFKTMLGIQLYFFHAII